MRDQLVVATLAATMLAACGARTGLLVRDGGESHDGAPLRDSGRDATDDAGVVLDAGMVADAFVPRPGRTIAAGERHTCAIDSHGDVWCWGANDHGQLGDGTTVPHFAPVLVHGVHDAVEVAAAGVSLARLASGEVMEWGNSPDGESATLPTPVPGLLDVTALATAGAYCAVHSGGRIACWGSARFGVLGDGVDYEDFPLPRDVGGVVGQVGVSGCGDATCAWSASGRATCWGRGATSVLADASDDFTDPYAIFPPSSFGSVSDVAQVAMKGFLTCVRDFEGGAECWGRFGSAVIADRPGVPSVIEVHDASDIAVTDGATTVCITHRDGSVGCLGADYAGQRGDGVGMGTLITTTLIPIPDLSNIVELTAGRDHVCARDGAQQVYCWGYNADGQIGDGTTTQRNSPVPIAIP